MQFTTTRIAAAAVLALAAGSASAIVNATDSNRPLVNYTTGTTDVFLAGSSAVDEALTKFIANACDVGTLDVYRSDSTGTAAAGAKTFYLWTCESTVGSANGFGLTANSKIAIHKNTNSSGDGLSLLQDATGATVAYLSVADVQDPTKCLVTPTDVPATTGIPAYKQFTCGTNVGVTTAVSSAGIGTQLAQPQFGFSDSEPAQYGTAAQVAAVTATYPFGLIFGIPVSTVLRNALQTQQGLTAGSDALIDMPNITSAQINRAYTGANLTWSAVLGLSPTALASDSVYKVRRSNTSGTTRIFNATFIGQFCTPGVPVLQAAPAATAIAVPATQCVAANRYTQANTSDDMRDCIASYNTLGLGAIGHLSTDYRPAAADGYRWVKVDGNAPTLGNVIDGKWKMWSELSMTYNNLRAPAGDVLGFYNRFKTASADAAYLSEVDKGLGQNGTEWVGGIVGLTQNATNGANTWGFPVSAANLLSTRDDTTVLNNPVSPFSRRGGAGYNLCAPLTPAAGYQAKK